MNLARTSKDALREAAAVCARRRGGRAFVGRLLAQAETTSLTAWCISSEARWRRSRLSRKARAIACSPAVGSCGIRSFGAKCWKCSRLPIVKGGPNGVNGGGGGLCLIVGWQKRFPSPEKHPGRKRRRKSPPSAEHRVQRAP